MTDIEKKREEIRENLAEVLSFSHEPDEPEWAEMDEHKKTGYRNEALNILSYLHSQGVVIKVDRELPDYLMEGQVACDKPTYQEMLRRAKYVAVEPLINTEKGGELNPP